MKKKASLAPIGQLQKLIRHAVEAYRSQAGYELYDTGDERQFVRLVVSSFLAGEPFEDAWERWVDGDGAQ